MTLVETLKFRQQECVWYGVECFREIEKDQDGKYPFVNYIANVVENTQKGCISMATAKTGLL